MSVKEMLSTPEGKKALADWRKNPITEMVVEDLKALALASELADVPGVSLAERVLLVHGIDLGSRRAYFYVDGVGNTDNEDLMARVTQELEKAHKYGSDRILAEQGRRKPGTKEGKAI